MTKKRIFIDHYKNYYNNIYKMTGYASVVTEIYKEDVEGDRYFATNRLIRKDQFLITYDTCRDVYQQIYHRFESFGCGPEYTLLILDVIDVTSEFYYGHTTSYTHFHIGIQNPLTKKPLV